MCAVDVRSVRSGCEEGTMCAWGGGCEEQR